MASKRGIVVYAFAGTGKTTFSKQFKNVLDLEESTFRYLEPTNEKNKGLELSLNPNFPQNYFSAIDDAIKKYDYVFVGYNAIKYCQDKLIDYFIILPKLEHKETYLQRYKNRGNPNEFVENLDKNFGRYLKKESKDTYAEKIVFLNKNEYVFDVFKKLGLIDSGKCLPYENNLVSLVIPCHNGEKTLPRLFNSIKKQTHKNFEVVLVNDSSTDNTANICKQFKNNFKNFFYSEQSFRSASDSRNYGLKNASGRYICFVDSDDELEPQYIKKLLHAMQTTNSDMVMSGLNEINNNVKLSFRPPQQATGTNHDPNLFIGLFNNCWFPVPWNKMFKKNIISNNKLAFPKGIHYDEDTVFNFYYYRLARRITIIPDKLYNYYIHKNSLTHKGEEKIFISSEKTIPFRIKYPIELFGQNKEAVFISAKKILKAVLQEGTALFENKKPINEILNTYQKRLANKHVITATKYLTVLENNYNEYFLYNKIFKNKDEKAFLKFIQKV